MVTNRPSFLRATRPMFKPAPSSTASHTVLAARGAHLPSRHCERLRGPYLPLSWRTLSLSLDDMGRILQSWDWTDVGGGVDSQRVPLCAAKPPIERAPRLKHFWTMQTSYAWGGVCNAYGGFHTFASSGRCRYRHRYCRDSPIPNSALPGCPPYLRTWRALAVRPTHCCSAAGGATPCKAGMLKTRWAASSASASA